MIKYEITKNLFRYKTLKIMSIITLSLCFFSVNIILSNIFDVSYMDGRQENRIPLKLVDNMDETRTLSIYFTDINRLRDLKLFSNELENAEEFDYCAFYSNYINIAYNQAIPQEMFAFQEHVRGTVYGEDVLGVNAIQVGKTASEFFPLFTADGRYFTDQDFNFNDKYINIILGSSYKDIYKVGDQTKIEYWGKLFDATIVGFLDAKSYIIQHGKSISLSNYIIAPFLDCGDDPIQEDDKVYQGISYTSFINGYAFLKDGYNTTDIISKIDSLCKIYDIPAFAYEGMNTISLGFLNFVLQLGRQELYIFGAVTYFTAFLSFYIIQQFISSRNRENYRIHFLMGARPLAITGYISLDILFQIIAALVGTTFVYSFYIGTIYFNVKLILLVFPMIVITISAVVYRDVVKNYYFKEKK